MLRSAAKVGLVQSTVAPVIGGKVKSVPILVVDKNRERPFAANQIFAKQPLAMRYV